MNTSLSWIKAYVPDLDVTAQEYTDAMTLSGTKVEGYEMLDADLEKIVIGQIEKIEKHPDADKLVVCQVNVGSETVQIVTGAKMYLKEQKFRLYWTADVWREAMTESRLQVESRSKRKIAWGRQLRYDVFYRGTWIYKGHVSGSSRKWNLHF